MNHENHKNHSHHENEKAKHGNHHEGEDHKNHHQMMVKDFKKRFFISLILSIPVIIFSPLIGKFLGFNFNFKGEGILLLIFSTAIFFYGGKPFLKGALDELRKKVPGMMTLIGLAISVAFIYSTAVSFGLSGKVFFWEIVTLIDIMLLGHWIEMRQVLGASRALEELVKLMPSTAHKIEGENVIDISVNELKEGDIVLVKPGEKIPVDGEIIEGETHVNESMLTGESKPIPKQKGDELIGGSINGESSIKVSVKKTGEESYLSQVVNLTREAQESRSKARSLANKAAAWLTIVAVTVGILTLIVWLLLGREFSFALERMVTVMVITCPHALGLAVPLVVAVSTSISAKKGLLIRDRVSFERAKDIDLIIFDKTGTLTLGEFQVSDVKGGDETLSLAASLSKEGNHPINKAIAQKAKEEGVEIKEVKSLNSIPGKGLEGKVEGEDVKLVGKNYIKEKGLSMEEYSSLLSGGKTVSFVIKNENIIGAVALSDIVREESKESIRKLEEKQIKTMMLTGDNKETAKSISDELGLSDFFAEVLPDEKSKIVKSMQEKGYKVAMVGDGVNDAPALATSDLGIAIGAGTDVAVEAGDIVLVRSNPMDVVSILGLSKATYKKMKQNLWWASGYNIVAIPLAAGVLYNLGIILSPAAGAVLMSLSTVIVAINAKFLKI